MNPVDLAFAPALLQAQLVRQGEVSPLELVQLYLERIERLNSQLGCYFTVVGEQALSEAKAKTEQLAKITNKSQLPPFLVCQLPLKTSMR